MKAKITFKQQNPAFDKEYAKQHFGSTSGNAKDIWSRTIGFGASIKEINTKRNTVFQTPDFTIEKVAIFEFVNEDDDKEQFIVSESLISNIHQTSNSRYNSSHLYIYFKDTNNYYKLGEQMYIAHEDVPATLMELLSK